MEPWEIAVIVIASLIGLYILFFLMRLLFALLWRSSMHERLRSLSYIIKEELNIMKKYDDFFENHISERPSHLLNETWIRDTQGDILLYARKHQIEEKDMETLNDLFANYQRIAARYNRDIIGYEYWRANVVFRYLFNLFGLKQRQRLA